MEIFGYSLETIYLIGLIVGGCLVFIYILLSDILEGMFEFLSGGIFNPTLVLSFIAILSAAGYILEISTSIHSLVIFIISLVLSGILVTLLNLFILIPLSSAESSLVYTDDDLKGRVGKVIISIPDDGYGEVVISGKGGTISKSAKSFEDQPIPEGTEVLVIDIKNGVVFVSVHDQVNFKA
ncbi:NfeD family protein [Virgibacillus oceani]|uniref:Membrane protein YuaF n=1 Tax=Virgibacillus oceani TaxID=1479511 RepID=A0A917M2H7_9BACI|nr:NfeD family protein [Virgibacillus oceani]GGG70831.1 putative membrane protein YuaF [Virgibacillus oceani]